MQLADWNPVQRLTLALPPLAPNVNCPKETRSPSGGQHVGHGPAESAGGPQGRLLDQDGCLFSCFFLFLPWRVARVCPFSGGKFV